MFGLVTSQFKEFNIANSEMSKVFKDLIAVVSKNATLAKDIIHIRDEERTHKLMLKE